MTEERRKAFAIKEIDALLQKSGKSVKDYLSLPQLEYDFLLQCENRLLYEEYMYDKVYLAEESLRLIPKLNEQQRLVCDSVISSVNEGKGRL